VVVRIEVTLAGWIAPSRVSFCRSNTDAFGQ
jgi:hypothetical protein